MTPQASKAVPCCASCWWRQPGQRQLIQINFYGRLLNVNRQLLTCPSLGNNRRRVKNGVGSFLTLWEDRWVPPFRRGAAVAWECIVLWFLRGSP
jgi:hypothetical protein